MNIERDLPYAVSVKGSFQYETTRTQGHADERAVRGAVNLGAKLEDLKKRLKSPLSTPISSQIDLGALGSTAEKNESVKEPFILKDVNLDIPHGESSSPVRAIEAVTDSRQVHWSALWVEWAPGNRLCSDP